MAPLCPLLVAHACPCPCVWPCPCRVPVCARVPPPTSLSLLRSMPVSPHLRPCPCRVPFLYPLLSIPMSLLCPLPVSLPCPPTSPRVPAVPPSQPCPRPLRVPLPVSLPVPVPPCPARACRCRCPAVRRVLQVWPCPGRPRAGRGWASAPRTRGNGAGALMPAAPRRPPGHADAHRAPAGSTPRCPPACG